MCVSVCKQMNICVLTHVEPAVNVRKFSQFLPALLFGDRRCEPGTCPLARLAGQPAPETLLSLPLVCWHYRFKPLLFIWMLGT